MQRCARLGLKPEAQAYAVAGTVDLMVRTGLAVAAEQAKRAGMLAPQRRARPQAPADRALPRPAVGASVGRAAEPGLPTPQRRPRLREGGFSIEMTIQAYSVQDAYIYGFALQEKSLPFDNAQESAAVAEEQVRQFAEHAQERQSAALAEEFPYLAEVVAGHVAKVGYDFTTAFEYGLDLILDALEKRRDTA